MSRTAVIESLGYDQSPNFFDSGEVRKPSLSRFSHVYRKAVEDCGLRGVYVLNDRQRKVVNRLLEAGLGSCSFLLQSTQRGRVKPHTPAHLESGCGAVRAGRNTRCTSALLRISIWQTCRRRPGTRNSRSIDRLQ